jgi:hypothetical protein
MPFRLPRVSGVSPILGITCDAQTISSLKTTRENETISVPRESKVLRVGRREIPLSWPRIFPREPGWKVLHDCEIVRCGLRVQALPLQFSGNHSRKSAPPAGCRLDWNLRCLSGLRTRVPLRLARNEGDHVTVGDAAVHGLACGEGSCLTPREFWFEYVQSWISTLLADAR